MVRTVALLLVAGIAMGCSSSRPLDPATEAESAAAHGGPCPTLCMVPQQAPYCTDTTKDANNCGGCGNACPWGQDCINSECVCPSATPNLCGGGTAAFCTNFATDQSNCGACGNVCGPGMKCSPLGCVETCAEGTTPCPAAGVATYCANLPSDNANCGACGATCDPAQGRSCQLGACVCTRGLSECAGVCVDMAEDVANCGACGKACSPGQQCVAGACTCVSPRAVCGGNCIDVSSDHDNCGACANVCGPDQTCSAGVCTCSGGLSACGTHCTDLSSDRLDCGACGVVCPSTQADIWGPCCGGQCTDFMTDRNNCGACGVKCAAGEICAPFFPSGQCTTREVFNVTCYEGSGCGDGAFATYDYIPPGSTILSTHTVSVDLYSVVNPPHFQLYYPDAGFGVPNGAPISAMVPTLPPYYGVGLMYTASLAGVVGVYGAAGFYEDRYHLTDRVKHTFLYGHRQTHYDSATCGTTSSGVPYKSYYSLVCTGVLAQ